ncbi:FKBP-type peptidyl-prolyl cis-trans isomerase [Mailhella massiliensis]|uniref:FKBP-type peptidyl-prolyl cis-trans isomerase n=1 Tax=Mailhella massiliensis TaxID=1903261 RepID=UPI00097CEE0D|nr:peptidylprolyl isomerase [Mailhella massiliensis]
MPIKPGDTVSVHYVGTLNDGSEFDRSREGSPLRFKVGSGQVIPGFDKAVMGHEVGDKFSVTIPAAEAYGARQQQLLFPVPLEQVPPTIKPQVGMMLHVSTDQGELEVTICEVNDKHIVLDANHPMAGKDLTFALEVVSID